MDILGVRYEVAFVERLLGDDGKVLNGDINYESLVIRIESSLPEAMMIRVMMHEIVHAVLYQSGFVQHKEKQVQALGFGLVAVLQANHDLARALIGMMNMRFTPSLFGDTDDEDDEGSADGDE